jgi:hypothetical protein
MYIVDPGRFKKESTLTHCVDPDEVRCERPKARSAARLCHRVSPGTKVRYYDGFVQDLDIAALADADLVALATDNLAAEVEVAQRCLHLRKPLAHAGVHGDSLTAQVRWYSHSGDDAPCLRCAFTRDEEEQLNGEAMFSCSGVAGDRQPLPTGNVPTMSTAGLCSLAADLAIMLILRFVLRLGTPLTDQQIELCGYNNRAVVTPLRRKSSTCKCDHTPWRVEQLRAPLKDMTLRELAARSGLACGDNPEGTSFIVSNMHFVELAGCGECGPRPLGRFLHPGSPAGACRTCQRPMYAHPSFTHTPVTAAKVAPVLDRPLRQIGAARASSVLVRRNEAAVLFRNHAHGAETRKGEEA